jgi:HK97 family phage major capsid protein
MKALGEVIMSYNEPSKTVPIMGWNGGCFIKSHLKPPYRSKVVFLTNDTAMKQLRKVKDSNGQYIWTPSVVAGTPDMLLGRPVYTSPFVPEIAAGSLPLAFGDFSFYWIADRRDIRFKVLNELYAERDQIGFHATERIDGKMILSEAVKLLQMGEEP